MKHNTLKLGIFAMAIMSTLFFGSCKRDRIKNNDTDTSYAIDNALSEFAYNDALNISDEASTLNTGENLGNYKTASNCATVTHDTTTTPKTITINFGLTNCLCNDGRYRKGKIEVSYTGHYKDSGMVRTITFDNYFVNNNQILGSKTIQNMGHNSSNQTYFTITINGLIIKATTGDSIIWNQNRVRTYTAGENTANKLDDVYSITGSGTGTKANGISYTMTITQPLVKAISCSWIEAGEIQIQPTGGNLKTINYGNGTCDDQATVTINGATYPITLN